MASKSVFGSVASASRQVPATDTTNLAGGSAYTMSAKSALAQLACTGCFNQTYYVKPEDQLKQVIELAGQVEPAFVAKLACYARESGYMKDMPATLVAFLSTKVAPMAASVFPRVIDNGKMLRNFAQIIRSGCFGQKNLSSSAKRRMICNWFEARSDEDLFFASTGTSPSLGDILKMVHPEPKTKSRSALYAYLIGHDTAKFDREAFIVADALPPIVAAYEKYRKDPSGPIPKAPFEMLLGLNLSEDQWKEVARAATWTQTFKNLNTFARHGVFSDETLTREIAAKLKDEKQIVRAKVFPYQVMMAYMAVAALPAHPRPFGWGGVDVSEKAKVAVPAVITLALQDALEIATRNVPSFPGKIVVCPDVSGSMHDPVTGLRGTATSAVRCIDVAGLIASTILRQNQDAMVLPFHTEIVPTNLNARDSVMTNAQKLANSPGGGTNCSLPLDQLNKKGIKADVVIYVSDNESWADRAYGHGTGMMSEWAQFKRANPKARLICIDLTPNATTQVKDNQSILNIGGFSDQCFSVIQAFLTGDRDHWVEMIEKVQI